MMTSTLAGALSVTRWPGGELSHCSLVDPEEVAAPLQELTERGQVVEPLDLQLGGGISDSARSVPRGMPGQLMVQHLLHVRASRYSRYCASSAMSCDRMTASRLGRIAAPSPFGNALEQVLIAVEIPVAKALIHVPVHPEPSALVFRPIEKLTGPLIRVTRCRECHRHEPSREVLDVDLLRDPLHREGPRVRTHSNSLLIASWLSGCRHNPSARRKTARRNVR